MLFVAPEKRGRGLGRELVEYLVARRGVRRVDVNEQNAQAAGFYARMGFRVVSRSETDPLGPPLPHSPPVALSPDQHRHGHRPVGAEDQRLFDVGGSSEGPDMKHL